MKPIIVLLRAVLLAVIGVATIVQPLAAGAAVADDIQGTWVLDIPATEQAIYAAPPYELARGFAMVSAYACLLRLKVENTTVSIGGDLGTLGTLNLVSIENGQYLFSPNPIEGAMKNKNLLIYRQTEKNLRIYYTDNPHMRHMLWKQAESKSPQTTEDRIREWMSALERIEKLLNAPQPIIPPDAAQRR